MRKIGCEDCEAQVQHLTRSRSMGVREREALWRAIHVECRAVGCSVECPARCLIARVSSNLSAFIERLDRREGLPNAKAVEDELDPVVRNLVLREP